MKQKLTLKNVAQLAGVSEMTASRALRNVEDVSNKSRQKVLAAVAELGYVPNNIAGALSSNKVNLVGIVIPSVKSYVFSEVLDGISAALKQSPFRPVFGMTNYDLDVEAEVIRDMLAWRPAGLIVAGLEHSETAQKILSATITPLVEIMDVDGESIDSCVGISHYRAGYKMALAIVERGHRNIGFMGTKMSSDFRATKRFNGFVDGLQSQGLKLVDEEHYDSGSTVLKGKEFTAAMLERSPSLHCIYCSTDVLAIGAVMYAQAAGIDIPNRLAIAGFNGLSMASGLPVELATTDSLRFDIGQAAAEMIIRRNMPNGQNEPERLELYPKVHIGSSI